MQKFHYPRVVGHRGGGKLAPENTLQAIDLAASMGVQMIEFDAKLSADDVVFLLHDDKVDRTSNGRGLAKTMSYADVSALDAGAWFDSAFATAKMPTLQQVADKCEQLGLLANIEIKPCEGRDVETGKLVAEEAVRLWGRPGLQHLPPPLISSFSYDALAQAQIHAPSLPRGMLYDDIPSDWHAQAKALESVSLHADYQYFTQTLVAEIKAAGLMVLAYTVNDPADAERLLGWGVDMICTDRIDVIHEPQIAQT